MLKFRKKNEQLIAEQDNELHKTMDEHLELIRKNQKLLNELLDDMYDISKCVFEHSEAIDNLHHEIEATQELIRNSKEEIS